MNIINLTPHAITVFRPEGGQRVFPPSGVIARVFETRAISDSVDGVRVEESFLNEVDGLPEPVAGTVYIVSAMVRAAAEAAGRTDVVSPDTGATAVREDGQIIAVRGFVRGRQS